MDKLVVAQRVLHLAKRANKVNLRTFSKFQVYIWTIFFKCCLEQFPPVVPKYISTNLSSKQILELIKCWTFYEHS